MSYEDGSKIEYILMSAISSSDQPIGAGALRDILEDHGVCVGEATVGRCLRKIEKDGYLERVGFRGRRLTAEGELRMKELSSEHGQMKSAEALIASMKSGGYKHLKDLMVARRALEAETASLAALNVTDEDLMTMREALYHMDNLKMEGKSIATTDAPFHDGIAKASRNKVLEFALKLIRHNQDYTSLLEYIRTLYGSIYQSDHWKIYKAIEARNPDEAKILMTQHIDTMIKEITEYEKTQDLMDVTACEEKN